MRIRILKQKKAQSGFMTVKNMIIVLVLLGILLYIIYFFLWEKIIKGNVEPIVDNTGAAAKKAGKEMNSIFGVEDQKSSGENAKKNSGG